MIADYGLHDSQAQSCTVLLGGVVRSEETLALFLGEPGAGVGDFQPQASGRSAAGFLAHATRTNCIASSGFGSRRRVY